MEAQPVDYFMKCKSNGSSACGVFYEVQSNGGSSACGLFYEVQSNGGSSTCGVFYEVQEQWWKLNLWNILQQPNLKMNEAKSHFLLSERV